MARTSSKVARMESPGVTPRGQREVRNAARGRGYCPTSSRRRGARRRRFCDDFYLYGFDFDPRADEPVHTAGIDREGRAVRGEGGGAAEVSSSRAAMLPSDNDREKGDDVEGSNRGYMRGRRLIPTRGLPRPLDWTSDVASQSTCSTGLVRQRIER